MLGVAVADRQHVAVEVHGAFWLARGARGEANEAHVIRGGVAGGEMLIPRLLHHGFQAVVAALTPIDDALEIGRHRPGLLHLVGKPRVTQCQRDLALGDRIAQLLGTKQRHGRHHHRAGFQRGQIDGDHHRIVGGAQQHAIASDQPEIARQHVGDAVHPLGELRVAQRFRWRDQAGPGALARRDPAVEELGDAVEPIAVAQLRKVEAKLRPLRARRQVVPREGVDVPRRRHRCPYSAASAALPCRFFSASRAITIFCTSVAPS